MSVSKLDHHSAMQTSTLSGHLDNRRLVSLCTAYIDLTAVKKHCASILAAFRSAHDHEATQSQTVNHPLC